MRSFPIIAIIFFCVSLPASWAQQLTCRPCIHGFGDVKVGTTASYSIHLVNTGTKPLYIRSKSKTGSSEFLYGTFTLPIKLLPGQHVLMPIVFKPTVVGRVTGTFIVTSSALDPTVNIQVAGIGVTGAQLNLSPSSLNFGSITVGKSATLATTLSAAGGSVTISSDQVTSSEFVLSGLTLPVTIPSGSSLQVKIKFTPTQSGTATAKIGYFSNAAISPAVEQLSGTGVATSAHSVTLSWLDSGAGVIGYNIYRASTHGGPYHIINTALDSSRNYVDYSVTSGTTYYYVTTAVNSSGAESGYSNESKAVIPSP